MPSPPADSSPGPSVVLVANAHNPSIINHDFLVTNEIVGADWESKPDSVTTAVFSQINYDDIFLSITPDRCSIIQTSVELTNPNLYDIAKKYAKTLKYVPYVAIGLNWRGILNLTESGNVWAKSKLLKDGAWQNNVQGVNLDVKMSSKDSSTFSVSVNSPLDPQKHEVMISCNFHFEIQNETDKLKRINKILSQHKNYENIFRDYLNQHFRDQ